MEITVYENHKSLLKCDVSMENPNNLKTEIKSFWNKIITSSYLKTINGKPHHSKKHTGEREFPLSYGNFTSLSDYESSDKLDTGNIALNKEQLIEKWLNGFNWDLYTLKWRKDGGKIVNEDQGTYIYMYIFYFS